MGKDGPVDPLPTRPVPRGATTVAPGTKSAVSDSAAGGSAAGGSAAGGSVSNGSATGASVTGSASPAGESSAPAAMGSILPANPSVPACTTHSIVNSGGGPVISTPKVHFIFWGNWSNGNDPYYELNYAGTWNVLANSPAFYTRVSEYGISPGTFGGYTSYNGASGSLPESTITSGLVSAVGTNTGASDIWVIFLANGTTSQYDASGGFGAHHQTFTNSGTTYRYAVIEYVNGTTNPLVSHEIMEAATDPDFTAFIDLTGPLCGNEDCEIGDPCQNSSTNFRNVVGYQIEQVWSQKACRCVTERDLGTVNYPNYLGIEDPTVMRPSNAEWFVQNDQTVYWYFGQAGDVPYVADFNGDGQAEWALFRDGNPAWVYQLNTTTGNWTGRTYGTTGDNPVRGDFDGDGISDISVWRPSSGQWFAILSSGGNYGPVAWGQSGDIPVSGDYDGDGKTDLAVFRGSDHKWYVKFSSTGGTMAYNWSGAVGDIPTPGDYNGDGLTDFAYWHPSDATWHVWYNGTGTAFTTQWGATGDIPLVGDFDNDWQTDLAVWRPSNGHWYVVYSSTFVGTDLGAFGVSGDIPVHRAVLR